MADTEAELTPAAPADDQYAGARNVPAAGMIHHVELWVPARTAGRHDRCRPGLNHLAFFAADRAHVDELVAEALLHGWKLLFTDRHPYAGGEHHYAAYLENGDGYEVELVAGS